MNQGQFHIPQFLCTWNFVISAGVVDVEAVVEVLRWDLPPGPGPTFAYWLQFCFSFSSCGCVNPTSPCSNISYNMYGK